MTFQGPNRFCGVTQLAIPWKWHREEVLLNWLLLWEPGVQSSKGPSEDPYRMHFRAASFLKLGSCSTYLPIPILSCLRTALGALTSPWTLVLLQEHCPREWSFRESLKPEKQSGLLSWSGSVCHRCSWNQRLLWHGTPHASPSVSKSDLTPRFSNSLTALST